MSRTRTYEVTFPDGGTKLRRTDSKTYTHATIKQGRAVYGDTGSAWSVWRWSESRRAAEAYAHSVHGKVVEVVELTAAVKAQRKAAARGSQADAIVEAATHAAKVRERKAAARQTSDRGARGEHLDRQGVELADGSVVVLAFAEFELARHPDRHGYVTRCRKHGTASIVWSTKADAEKMGARKMRATWCGGCEFDAGWASSAHQCRYIVRVGDDGQAHHRTSIREWAVAKAVELSNEGALRQGQVVDTKTGRKVTWHSGELAWGAFEDEVTA